ncbi:MAG: hypothetical protein AAGF11_47450 [Myxococcota bacterium]
MNKNTKTVSPVATSISAVALMLLLPACHDLSASFESSTPELDDVQFNEAQVGEVQVDTKHTIRISAKPTSDQAYRFGIRTRNPNTGAVLFTHMDPTILISANPSVQTISVDIANVPFDDGNLVEAIIWTVDAVSGERVVYGQLQDYVWEPGGPIITDIDQLRLYPVISFAELEVEDLDTQQKYIDTDSYEYRCSLEWSPVLSPSPHPWNFKYLYTSTYNTCTEPFEEDTPTRQYLLVMAPGWDEPDREYTYGVEVGIPNSTNTFSEQRVQYGIIEDIFTVPDNGGEVRLWISHAEAQPDGTTTWPDQEWSWLAVHEWSGASDTSLGTLQGTIIDEWDYVYECSHPFDVTVSPTPHPNDFASGWSSATQRCVGND